MIELSIADVARAIGGRLVGPPDAAAAVVSGDVHTDSRSVTPGDVFFALPGETTDGHLFAPAAVENGAALLVVERELDAAVPQLVVPDGVVALSDLAREVVARVRAGGQLKVVAVTGSNGKTTTKNMMRAIFGAEGKTVAPTGSFNNEVGAPISMLGIEHDTRFLVVEMGADGVGDIANEHGLKFGFAAAEQRQHRRNAGDRGETVEEGILGPEHDRGTQDHGGGQRLEHGGFALGLAARVSRFAVLVRADRGHVNQLFNARRAGGAGNRARAERLHGVETLATGFRQNSH